MIVMKDSGIEWIGEIPEHWQILFAFQVFDQVKNKNSGLAENNLLSLSDGKIKRKNIETTFGLLPESFEGYNIIYKNDIALRLTDLQNDQKSLRVGISEEQGIITSAYVTLRTSIESYPKYLYYYLHSFDISKGFYGMGAGVRQGLNWNELKHLLILFPKISEQKAIADYLERQIAEIDSVIERTKSSIEEYKKLKQSVITEAVTKGIRPNREMKDSGIEWIGKIPTEWRLSKIKVGVTKVGSGKTPSGGADVYSAEGVLFLRSQNIYDTGLILDPPTYIPSEIHEEMKNTRVVPNDVLLNITGGSIGRCCIFLSEFAEANVNQHVSIIRVIKDIFIPEFMHLYWVSYLGKMSIQLYQTGGNREGMTAEAIKNSPIPIPSIPEQSEIVAYLDKKTAAIDSLIQKKEQLITELEAYKKSLIYEYVTGKKEVSDNETIALSLDFQIALLICNILKNTDVKGRIHLQKIIFALDTILGLFSGTQYYRYPHGPYDLNIEKYESIMESQGWVTVDKSKGYVRYTKTNRFFEFESRYQDIFKEKDNEIRNICNLFNVKRTSKAEKMATVLASWNDFLIEGVKPTDEMIVNDIVTNWTENKANISEETWREIIHQLKEKQMIPKGYGKHTLKKEQNDYAH